MKNKLCFNIGKTENKITEYEKPDIYYFNIYREYYTSNSFRKKYLCQWIYDNNECECFRIRDYYNTASEGVYPSYFDYNGYCHKLIGPAIINYSGNSEYQIHGVLYLYHIKEDNILYVESGIIALNAEYKDYIRFNLDSIIDEFNPKIELSDLFKIDLVNALPDYIKNLIII